MKKLVSDHIILRKAKVKDAKLMLENIWSDEEIYKYMAWKPVFTMTEAKERINYIMDYQKYNYYYHVCLKDTNEPIGFAGIREIGPGVFSDAGICIARKCQGLGYGKEVLALLLDLAFNKLQAREFIYGCMSHNIKSQNLCLKFGFEYSYSNISLRAWDNYTFQDDHYLLKREKYLKLFKKIK